MPTRMLCDVAVPPIVVVPASADPAAADPADADIALPRKVSFPSPVGSQSDCGPDVAADTALHVVCLGVAVLV